MITETPRRILGLAIFLTSAAVAPLAAQDATPFGERWPMLDSQAVGSWWVPADAKLMVPRDETVAFAIYTHDSNTLKLTAQLYPLLPDEPRKVTLELFQGDRWQQVAASDVVYPGWSAHFRIDHWDSSQDVPYRVRHGNQSVWEGLIRHDPIEKEVIVVASLSCNSSRTPGARPQIVENLKILDPDLLFFAGDQSYHHTQHTFGWLEFGVQFRDVMRDRPVVTIPDDHDVGQANIWGENGKAAATSAGADGGYFYPAAYVNMVQRCQTWHLPDPADPAQIEQGITVYFARLRVGGVDFAILEDRKFKSGPQGKIPRMGPRPDHITDESYDPRSIDLEGLELLGRRQLQFLEHWSEDWTGAAMKCVLSQTAFCGAVHMHGGPNDRLLADLDCNGWPQRGRCEALRAIRRAQAVHLCGDQHLAVVVKHGIDTAGDGPYGFTSPAIVNTIYGRWWHPVDERSGPNAVPGSPLPWTGDFKDGLGNWIRVLAYANPANVNDERQRADGFGIARFNKASGEITFECWPRFSSASDPSQQFPGWPITIRTSDNDGRTPTGWLPALDLDDVQRPVAQVIDESTGEILYTVRADRAARLPVYSEGPFSVKAGADRPDRVIASGLRPTK